MVSDTKLLVPVKMLSFAILRQPVITEKQRLGLSLSAVLRSVLIEAEHFGIIPMAAGFCKWNIVFVQ